jgi:hypothetical protein
MEGIDKGSFSFGCIYGLISAGLLATALRYYLEAQFKSTARRRPLDRFADALQPTLTPDRIIETSQAERLKMIGWGLFMMIFGAMAVAGFVFILSA